MEARLTPSSRSLVSLLLTACAIAGTSLPAGQTDISPELNAFQEARAETSPASRVAALEAFLRAYPGSSHLEAANRLLLDTLLLYFPDRASELHEAATRLIARAAPGVERALEQAHLADKFASAGAQGADLPEARTWATEAVQHLTELLYLRESATMQARFGLPRLSAKALHAQFATDRATALLALANVDLQSGESEAATALLAEANRLDPIRAERFRLLAQVALQRHQDHQALLALIQSSALAPLPARWQAEMVRLFGGGEPDGGEALAARIDAAYNQLFPRPYTLPSRQLPPGGHPVLLELFTGSDCAPCAGPDLAVDSLLTSYGRQDLIALEYDEHIPRPDPLASPGGVERAAFYTVDTTPEAFLDGQPVQLLGSRRSDVENLVISLGDELEAQAALAAPVNLGLTAHLGPDGTLSAETSMTRARGAQAVEDAFLTGQLSLRTLERAVLFTALAEDNVRYTGMNGVRFHRMVVRDLRQTRAASLLGSVPAPAHFEWRLGDLAAQHRAYLQDFEQHNDRFGSFQFPVTDLPVRPDHLFLVAWLQDPSSRRILQSICIPVPAPH